MDVKPLYTVIPNDCGLQALAYFLDKRDIKEPTTSTLTRLAELVLTLNSFSFNNEYYRQRGGVAMGSRMGPNYACLFVGYVEQQIRERYTGFIPQLHKRYISATCRRDELDDFINFVANFHPALQFTSTITETELPFLDINLRISEDRIQTSAFYKETDTHNNLHFSSFHPDHCKRAIPYSQFLRLRRLCSDDDDFLIKAREMMTFFTQRGYPLTSLEQDLRKVTTIGRPDALTGSERGDTTVDRLPMVMTYHPFNTHIKRYLLQNFRIIFYPQTSSIRNTTPGFPVAQHFNSAGHSITDVQVRGMRLCRGSNILRKQLEMNLIFQLGTVQPHGLNINFK